MAVKDARRGTDRRDVEREEVLASTVAVELGAEAGDTTMKMNTIDVRGLLPVAPEYHAGTHPEKTSTTIHWPGIVVDPGMTEDEAIALLQRLAQGHIDRDWSAVFGQQGGYSLMYHEVVAPTGTVLIARDPEDIVWHAESEVMLMAGRPNNTSHAILVLSDSSGPTPAQLRTLAELLPTRPNPVYGNREWMATACPGDVLMAVIAEYRSTGRIMVGEEGTMITREEFDAYKAALQRQLDAVNAEFAAVDAKIAMALRKAADELDNV